MKVYDVEVLNLHEKKGELGEVVLVDKFGFGCVVRDGVVKFLEIALEGKKRCKVRDYFNGMDKESMLGKVLK